MKTTSRDVLRFVLQNYQDELPEEKADLANRLMEDYQELPDPLPWREGASLSTEDQVVWELIQRLPQSSPWKIPLFRNAHVVLVRLNAISLGLCAILLLFTVHIAGKVGAPLPATVVGAGACLFFLALFLVTRWAHVNFVDFLYVFLKDGDLPWFFSTNLYWYDLAIQDPKNTLKNHSLESSRVNLSTLLIRKYAHSYRPDKNYTAQRLLLYYCSFEELKRREATIHETSDSHRRIQLLTKVYAFSKESSLLAFQLGREYLEVQDLERATFFFGQASGREKNNVLFEGYLHVSRFLEARARSR